MLPVRQKTEYIPRTAFVRLRRTAGCAPPFLGVPEAQAPGVCAGDSPRGDFGRLPGRGGSGGRAEGAGRANRRGGPRFCSGRVCSQGPTRHRGPRRTSCGDPPRRVDRRMRWPGSGHRLRCERHSSGPEPGNLTGGSRRPGWHHGAPLRHRGCWSWWRPIRQVRSHGLTVDGASGISTGDLKSSGFVADAGPQDRLKDQLPQQTLTSSLVHA